MFAKLRETKQWWVAPAVSTMIGNLIDTILFFSIAFYASVDTFMAENWMEIAWVDYGFKVVISLAFFLPMYGLALKFLSNKLETITREDKEIKTT